MQSAIHFQLNGQPATVTGDDERLLLWVLRTDFGLTGTKYGCGAGLCGACTVTVGDRAVRSCRLPVRNIDGKSVVTIEGLASAGVLHPLQQAFIDHGGFQCGFCTAGMLMTASALLHESPHPARAAVVAHLDRNLCRCGAHQGILRAIEAVAHPVTPSPATAPAAALPSGRDRS